MKMFMKYSPVEIPDQYLTKKFLIDLAATWIIYEFIIAPIKWPYYFIATRYAVKENLTFVGQFKQDSRVFGDSGS